jgi:hypothetical protein
MRKIASLVAALSIAGSALVGGSAFANEPRADISVRFGAYPTEAPPVVVESDGGYRTGYVWVGGEYEWRHGRYILTPGHYVRAHRGYRWQASNWRYEHGRYMRTPGRWVR